MDGSSRQHRLEFSGRPFRCIVVDRDLPYLTGKGKPCFITLTDRTDAIAADLQSLITNTKWRGIDPTHLTIIDVQYALAFKGSPSHGLDIPDCVFSLRKRTGRRNLCSEGKRRNVLPNQTLATAMTLSNRAPPRVPPKDFAPLDVLHGLQASGISVPARLQRRLSHRIHPPGPPAIAGSVYPEILLQAGLR